MLLRRQHLAVAENCPQAHTPLAQIRISAQSVPRSTDGRDQPRSKGISADCGAVTGTRQKVLNPDGIRDQVMLHTGQERSRALSEEMLSVPNYRCDALLAGVQHRSESSKQSTDGRRRFPDLLRIETRLTLRPAVGFPSFDFMVMEDLRYDAWIPADGAI
ncbi:hypothetical protein QMK19_08395 [Streptomyces sp. H10-C2]|uniref:hypothetical protein n=1 Tax=unclassified Streptomyces TaxID=2593676 RepID=UPI0024B9AC18|nr:MULTISPECIES: hypothetical protein [unclassified Streptomyces]MDJ0344813.1 hypothetical protein [Streptomyces sp. PH10-H1]MDJ0369698.1 hypothetical protein [Streptomyces sp. H10-C2]